VAAATGRDADPDRTPNRRAHSFLQHLERADGLLTAFAAKPQNGSLPGGAGTEAELAVLRERSPAARDLADDFSRTFTRRTEQFRTEVLQPARQVREQPDDVRDDAQLEKQLEEFAAAAEDWRGWLETAAEVWLTRTIDLQDPKVAAALKQFDQATRWERAASLLTEQPRGLLNSLSRQHQVELLGIHAEGARVRWTSTRDADVGRGMDEPAGVGHTDLALGVRSLTESVSETAAAKQPIPGSGPRTAVVLVSDGKHNRGGSPVEIARQCGMRGWPIYAVALGSDRQPADLAMLSTESPKLVYREDQVRGRITFADTLPPGKPFSVRVEHDGLTLWEQPLTTTGAGTRTLEFAFSVREAVAKLLGPQNDTVRQLSVPLALQVRLQPVAGELRQDNNETRLHLRAITRRTKLLLVDGRPRWEMRYLRNLFERDTRWQVSSVLAGEAVGTSQVARGLGDEEFPPDRGKLLEYDLIVLGDISSDSFRDEELQWLKEFVEQRGGGMILVDGARHGLRSVAASTAGELLPVRWLPEDRMNFSAAAQWQLARTAQLLPAFALVSTDSDNDAVWRQLPGPHQALAVEALPGTETLVEIVDAQRTLPVLVTRRLGAGRVLYAACDESWRWRREVADLYHQKFWMQVAQWMMEEPFAVTDPYVSLDVGAAVYEPGDAAEIRVRLRDESGRAILDARAEALLWSEGKIAATVPLETDAGNGGVFRGRSGPLAPGDYAVSVRVGGLADDHFRARTQFRVEPPLGPELADLSGDPTLLDEMCRSAGGRSFREDEAARLVDCLRPLSTQRIVESETALWLSYWWFAPIVIVLGCEWLLRKRTGYL
jgi:uncharacterized membrane protein